MTAGFELLVSADLLVPDVLATSQRLVSVLGLPQPKPRWLQDMPDEQHQVNWLRVRHDRALAPTAIEVIGPHPVTGWAAPLETAHRSQGNRPMKTHNTVVGVEDAQAVIARLQRNDVAHFVDPGVGIRAFPRIWVGVWAQHGVYDPSFDAGLMIEILPTTVLALPEAQQGTPVSDVPAGHPVRVASRAFLVADMEQALGSIEKTLGWTPCSDVRESSSDQALVATFGGSMRHSATIELIQPTDDSSPAGERLRRYGPGADRITLAVNGIDAAAASLDERAIAYGRIADPLTMSGRLAISPAALDGFLFDLVDETD
jgi:hypothetical protein